MVLVSEGDAQLSEFIAKYKGNALKGGGALLLAYTLYRTARGISWQEEMKKKYGKILLEGSTWYGGNIADMIAAGGFSEEFFIRLHRAKGPIAAFFMLPNILNFSVVEPEMIQQVYMNMRGRPSETYIFLWYLGKENLLFQHGEHAKQMRLRYNKMITEESQLHKLNMRSMLEFNRRMDKWGMGTPVNIPKNSLRMAHASHVSSFSSSGRSPRIASDSRPPSNGVATMIQNADLIATPLRLLRMSCVISHW